ncbi:CIA30 family protein [Oscillatoria sp. FACHB-1407]|uniref:CIA30 family protein n=1 Tax=Oscillatoria sp. FACHB-1407 TaxID=2692847 RepID=UPI0016882FC8|nr:CIA30 family protein [Oscillatoria sp. FACHB-1407]MBD2461216.1 CIA30 family protein [Oscillatoria sp. FACHB-1407]
MSQPTGTQWDLGRFLQTLSYFETIPLISCLKKIMFGSTPPAPPQPLGNVLFDFQRSPEAMGETWGALDDVVMGGVSASSLQPNPEGALFTGYVSTANSGGFASVRTRNFEPPLDLANATGLELQIKGDGQRYKFLIRDANSWDSIAYSHSFDTVANEWITIQVPFAQLIPVFRAKTVNSAPPLNTAQIRSMQLMLSKFEYDGGLNPHFTPGEFRLLVRAIALY